MTSCLKYKEYEILKQSEEMEGTLNWKRINSTERQRDDKLLNGKLREDTQ